MSRIVTPAGIASREHALGLLRGIQSITTEEIATWRV
jgi:hypothetical protein